MLVRAFRSFNFSAKKASGPLSSVAVFSAKGYDKDFFKKVNEK